MLGSCGQPQTTELGRLTHTLQLQHQVIQSPPHLHMLLLDSLGVYKDICQQNAKGFKILSVALEGKCESWQAAEYGMDAPQSHLLHPSIQTVIQKENQNNFRCKGRKKDTFLTSARNDPRSRTKQTKEGENLLSLCTVSWHNADRVLCSTRIQRHWHQHSLLIFSSPSSWCLLRQRSQFEATHSA